MLDDLLLSTHKKDSNLDSGGEEEVRPFDIHDNNHCIPIKNTFNQSAGVSSAFELTFRHRASSI